MQKIGNKKYFKKFCKIVPNASFFWIGVVKGQGAKPFILAILAYCALLLGIACDASATGANQIIKKYLIKEKIKNETRKRKTNFW